MRLLSDKMTGSILTGPEFSELAKETENVITNFGQSLTSSDLSQLEKGVAGYASSGTLYTDSGSANGYVLAVTEARRLPPKFLNGFKAEFNTTNPNTGASTVIVTGLGQNDIKTQDGEDPLAGDISGFVTLVFDGTNFILINPSATGTTVEFKNVAEMIASPILSVGMTARTLGYTIENDGGGNDYSIISVGAQPEDGGLFINLIATPHRARGRFKDGVIRFEQFGAFGDDTIDDTVAINNAALTAAGSRIEILPKTYRTSAPVTFPSQKTFVGVHGRSRIKNVTSDRIIVSRAFVLTVPPVAPAGRMAIHHLEIEGDLALTDQIGLTIHDFQCDIRLVRVLTCGGGGIQLTHRNDQGNAILSSLIENRLTMPIISNCGGIGIDLGEIDNQKLTDGFIIGANIQMKAGGPVINALRLGSGVGWYMTGVHTFGEISPTAVQLDNCSRTRFVNFEIESFSNKGISCPKIQGDLIIQGHINANSATMDVGRAVDLDLSTNVSDTSVSVDIGVKLEVITTGIVCLNNQIGSADIQARIRRRGLQRDLLQLVDGSDQGRIDQIRLMADASVAGVFTDKSNLSSQIGLAHDGKRLTYSFYSSVLFSTGTQTVTVPVILEDTQKLIGTVNIEANDVNTPTLNKAIYQGRFFISAADNATDDWEPFLRTTIAPTGFTAVPMIAANHNSGEDDGTIVITFSFNSAAATGICSVTF